MSGAREVQRELPSDAARSAGDQHCLSARFGFHELFMAPGD
jgi:hypothetical protein